MRHSFDYHPLWKKEQEPSVSRIDYRPPPIHTFQDIAHAERGLDAKGGALSRVRA